MRWGVFGRPWTNADREEASAIAAVAGEPVTATGPATRLVAFAEVKQPRDPDDVHPPLAAYVHQIELSGGERLLVLSGQVGARLDGSIPDDPLDQLDVAWDNLERNLHAAGMDTNDLIKITLYLVGDIDTARRREVLARGLGAHKPCMTLLVVTALATPQLRVEIDAWASRSEP